MKARYILGIAAVAFAVGIWQVALHQTTAGNLAAKVTADDVASADATTDLQALGNYVKVHMATGRSVFLTASYNRAAQAAQAAASPTSNGAVYAAAQSACASHADSLVQARCVQSYLSSHSSTGTNPQPVATPAKADYTKSFVAPAWSADSAGIAFLVALGSALFGGYLLTQRRW